MSQVLEQIDGNLARIEDQVLLIFNEILQSDSASGFREFSDKQKRAIGDTIGVLRYQLSHSGEGELQIETELHEYLRSRLYVLEQLLHRPIPTRFIVEVHEQFNLPREEAKERARSSGLTIRELEAKERDKAGGFISFFKGLFNERSMDRRPRVFSEKTAAEQRQVYRDTGIYAPAKELATLASLVVRQQNAEAKERTGVVKDKETPKEASDQPTGKANFASRDLSMHVHDHATPKKPDGRARSPEEIRAKLAARGGGSTGQKATFASSDLKRSARELETKSRLDKQKVVDKTFGTPGGKASFVVKDLTPEPVSDRTTKAPLKRTESIISRESGKSTFVSRDVTPQQTSPQVETPKPKKKEPVVSREFGKASFETKDLTTRPSGGGGNSPTGGRRRT